MKKLRLCYQLLHFGVHVMWIKFLLEFLDIGFYKIIFSLSKYFKFIFRFQRIQRFHDDIKIFFCNISEGILIRAVFWKLFSKSMKSKAPRHWIPNVRSKSLNDCLLSFLLFFQLGKIQLF